MISFDNTNVAFASKNNWALGKTHFLFKVMASPTLVSWGSALMTFALKLRLPVKGLIRQSIFDHFCGGENITGCEQRITALGEYQIKTILDYSVEGKKDEQDLDLCTDEIVRTITRAKGDDNIPFAVFKVTGIASFKVLEKVSRKAELTATDHACFELVKKRINRICSAAAEAETPVFIDAEESWIQDTIDALAHDMMRKFNRDSAMVYNTAQMYRHDRLTYLRSLLEMAETEKFIAGVKLVRGAYMEKERERAKRMRYPSPIQPDKAATDRDFDEALGLLIESINHVALCCGSHNETSNLLLTELMKKNNIETDDAKVYFAQLLGMSDHISYNLSKAGYNVAKYVPYGPIQDVMPYLIRRAEENTSISGQTSRELALIQKEKKRRKLA